jgi:hypothetical protein
MQRQTARIERHLEDHRNAHLPDPGGDCFIETEIAIPAASKCFQVERRERRFGQITIAMLVNQGEQRRRCDRRSCAAVPDRDQRQDEAPIRLARPDRTIQHNGMVWSQQGEGPDIAQDNGSWRKGWYRCRCWQWRKSWRQCR